MQDSTDAAKAHAILTDLAQSGPEGYRVLARFQLAAAEAKAGEADKAVADYDALAVDPGVDPISKVMLRCKPPRSGWRRRTWPRWSAGSNL